MPPIVPIPDAPERNTRVAAWTEAQIEGFRASAGGRGISEVARAYNYDRRTVRRLLGHEVRRTTVTP